MYTSPSQTPASHTEIRQTALKYYGIVRSQIDKFNSEKTFALRQAGAPYTRRSTYNNSTVVVCVGV